MAALPLCSVSKSCADQLFVIGLLSSPEYAKHLLTTPNAMQGNSNDRMQVLGCLHSSKAYCEVQAELKVGSKMQDYPDYYRSAANQLLIVGLAQGAHSVGTVERNACLYT